MTDFPFMLQFFFSEQNWSLLQGSKWGKNIYKLDKSTHNIKRIKIFSWALTSKSLDTCILLFIIYKYLKFVPLLF